MASGLGKQGIREAVLQLFQPITGVSTETATNQKYVLKLADSSPQLPSSSHESYSRTQKTAHKIKHTKKPCKIHLKTKIHLDLKGLQLRAQQQWTIHPATDFIEPVLYLC